jgi:hypothetical protein
MLHQDWAYALYVREYTTGNFTQALAVSTTALAAALRVHVPAHPTSLCIARVHALVLEEMALVEAHHLGRQQVDADNDKLKQAEMLHLIGLEATRRNFGQRCLLLLAHLGVGAQAFGDCN